MYNRSAKERRSGVIFLVMTAATNVVLWMEPVSRARVAGELASPSEIRLGLISCFLAVGLLVTAWVLGHRPRPADRPEKPTARRLGLQISILSALLNLAFVGGILFLAPRFSGPSSLVSLVAIVWYLVLLPLQVAAAYWMGRGSMFEGRRTPYSRAPLDAGGP